MGYGMIADVGNLLVGILSRELVPDLIPHKNQIGLCSPDGHGDLKVGIFLYNISENPDIRISGMVNAGATRQGSVLYDNSIFRYGYEIPCGGGTPDTGQDHSGSWGQPNPVRSDIGRKCVNAGKDSVSEDGIL